MAVTPQVSGLLPLDAREQLIAASKVPDLRERTAAVQEAIEYAKRKYPQFFQGVTP